MFLRRIKRSQRWDLILQQSRFIVRINYRDNISSEHIRSTNIVRNHSSDVSLTRNFFSNSYSSRCIAPRSKYGDFSHRRLRFFSSEGDGTGRNASESNHIPVNNGANLNKVKTEREKVAGEFRRFDAHAKLGEQDQIEWLHNEKLAIESKKNESPFLSRRERFKNEFLRRIQPWDKIHLSWDTFPYYINDHTKSLLVECVASHIKQKKATSSFGAHLASSSRRILLQSVPGTELYRERLVRALAQDLQVSLLVLDSSVLAPYDFGEDYADESESETESDESESEAEDANEASNEEEGTSSNEEKTDGSDDDEVDLQATAEEALKKLGPYNLEELEKRVSEELENASGSSKAEVAEHSEKAKRPLKKGDRVKYVGPSKHGKENSRVVLGRIPTSDGPKSAYTIIRDRPLASGQRGEVYEVSGNQVAVVLDAGSESKAEKGENKDTEQSSNPPLHWINAKNLKHDYDTQAEDCYIAMEALCEVLDSSQPLIVYFPDSSQWLSRAVPKSKRKEFVDKVQEIFDRLSGSVVLICGQNKSETGSKEKEKITMILPNFGRLGKLPLPLKRLTEGLTSKKRSDDNEIYKLFMNVLRVHPPKEEDVLRVFNKQIEEDRKIVISRSNLNELNKVLEEHLLLCSELYHVNTDDVILTKQKAEKVIGWAKNHYLSSSLNPLVKGDRLCLPRKSLEIAILRLKEQETNSRKPSQSLKNLAKDDYETNFVSAVVSPGEIGVKFDDIGALEDVKKALNELVILPMRRPELFSHGNLLRPCKGILLFGPPGTGKTLLAKALATEAGANFISITGSTLTSKWFGDAEKLTKALFSFASKLAPVIIFVDEVDSLLGARGGGHEHEATRRMRNEFMSAWDGLRSKDSQRILILGATNRPFDLDDAVIRRLPRRIYVDLPDAKNRLKILKIFLAQENIETGFQFDKLAQETEGYSGSDLKNLCIAAAYRPVQELLEAENKGDIVDAAPALRPLSLDDFIESKAKVSPSVAYDATSMNELRKWNEQYGEGGSRRKSPFGF